MRKLFLFKEKQKFNDFHKLFYKVLSYFFFYKFGPILLLFIRFWVYILAWIWSSFWDDVFF